ncbi:putative integral membrane protein [Eutypa lata UCREL1]|uniref:Putative integral membrane protein n=1 Tax=Eutypa lata (strain UCR-EL1) TaxID=1287681 RepID=M7SFE9_EUTLA|nr:putative integral membrane protein [Eutypa lata UCREL1]
MSDPSAAAPQEGVSTNVYLGVGATLNVLAALFVIIRCTTNYSLNKLGADDLLLDPTTSLTLLIKMVVLIAVFVAFTLWSTKAPILVLYVKLFGVRTWLRWLSYLTLVVTGLNFLGSFILPVVQCDTGMTTPDPAIFLICQNATVTGGIWSGFVSIIEDVIIFCMPIPAILQLNLPTAKKVGVILVFFSGIIAIVASAVALAFKWQSMAGSSVGIQTAAMLCATIEANTALMVGCAPAVKAFWATWISKSNAAAKTQASSSASRSGRFWPSSKLSSGGRSKAIRSSSATSTNQIYDPNTANTYILMDTPRASEGDLEASKSHARQ